MFREVREWIKILGESDGEALVEGVALGEFEMDDHLSCDEVLDEVVAYEGGIATGSKIRKLVEVIYDITLV